MLEKNEKSQKYQANKLEASINSEIQTKKKLMDFFIKEKVVS